jgi:serine protease Do
MTRHLLSSLLYPLFWLFLLSPALAAPPEEINLRRTTTVEVVRKTKDAVVNISATKTVTQRVPMGFDPFWDSGQTVQVPSDSLGSGFIVHPDGYVVTNNHVIDRARKVSVELADGRKLPAEIIAADSDSDLAILKISSDKPFPIIDLGDSSDLMIGEPVIAVGNPMGYSHSVSTGIVSAIHRDLRDIREQRNTAKSPLQDLIQTDAAINPGNSGGPLLNAYGQVIGINTAVRGDAQNIGFAIPINRLRDQVPDLMSPAHATRMDIPVSLVEHRRLTPPAHIACEVDLAGGKGQMVLAINGHKPFDIIDAYAMLLRLKPEEKVVQLDLEDGTTKKIAIRPAPQPEAIASAKHRFGMVVQQLTPMLAEKLQVASEDGLFIKEVQRDSVAEKAGLRPGDILIQLGRYRVSTLQDLGALLDRLPEHGKVRVTIIRGDRLATGIAEF